MNLFRKTNKSVLTGKTTALMASAIAVLAIGCAGSGDGGGTSTSASATSAGNVPFADLGSVNGAPKPGQIEFSYLTGQGRSSSAPGDKIATIGLTELTDTGGRNVSGPSGSSPSVKLNGYQNQILRINADVSTIIEPDTQQRLNSRLFLNYNFEVTRVVVEDIDGNPSQFDNVVGLPVNLPTSIRVFPGRFTVQPIFANDAHFTVNDDGTAIDFNRTQFDQDNSLAVLPRLPSFLSDYLAFDISAIPDADKPELSTGEKASRIYFSGDTYAISQGGTKGLFEAVDRNNLNPSDPSQNLIEGRFAPPGDLFPGTGIPSSTPGTYSLIQPDPSDPFLIARITSLQGIWRNYTKMIKNMGDTIAITFPNKDDADEQDMLLIKQTVTNDSTGAVVTASIQSIHYGVINFSSGQIRLYPIKNITSASVVGEVTATVGQQFNKQGVTTTSVPATRYGTFTGLSLPGFPSTGTFVVYRY